MIVDLAHIVLIAFSISSLTLYQIERHRATKREQELIEAIMADNLTDYHNNPKNQMKYMEKESKLAENAYKLEQLTKEEREPGYQVN